ncbi:DUF222 domain-containing protein [Cellulomonas sp.]|uniref:HNH endonuclease signature motif containing protein n=1 Tax=Cellulomonas sp. TaxID=40001 RepID=UPI003BA9924C
MFESEVDARAGARLDRLRADAAALVEDASAASDWSGRERGAALASLDLVVAALARARAHLLVAERDAGTSQRPGDRTFEAARARLSRSSTGEASRQVRQADALVSMPTVATAVTDGRMPLGHLDTLARVAATASPQVASVLRSADAQATVVQMAVSQSEPDFARSLARFAAASDPAALESAHRDARRERYLTLSHQPRGTYLKGFLDRVSAEALQTALDSTAQIPDENRSPDQARADALIVLAGRACAGLPPRSRRASTPDGSAIADVGSDDSAAGASARAHVSLIVPAETFAELRTHYGAQEVPTTTLGSPASLAPELRALPDDAARVPAWAPVAPATLEDGTPVAMSVLAQALCDCEISRIVLSAEGVPLDLGRTKRTYTGVHRRAVVARDRQCAWNGCHSAARWSEVHHMRWWDRDGGATSVDNGVLLCSYHHGIVHSLDLTIQRHVRPPGYARRQRALGRPFDPGPARYTFWTRDRRPYSSPPTE